MQRLIEIIGGTNRMICLGTGIWGQVLVAEGAAGVASVRICQKFLRVSPAPGSSRMGLSLGRAEHSRDVGAPLG